MDEKLVYNVNVVSQDVLATPEEIKRRIPLTERAGAHGAGGRHTIERIIDRQGPSACSSWSGPARSTTPAAALDYARRLKALADAVSDTLVLVMRVYFEKPRTTVGWKGLINDPDMDDSFHIEKGIGVARQLLLDDRRSSACRRRPRRWTRSCRSTWAT